MTRLKVKVTYNSRLSKRSYNLQIAASVKTSKVDHLKGNQFVKNVALETLLQCKLRALPQHKPKNKYTGSNDRNKKIKLNLFSPTYCSNRVIQQLVSLNPLWKKKIKS